MNRNAPRETSTLAIVSLIFGILGWILLPVLGSLTAVVTGHMARAELRREPIRLKGDELAVAGLILGYSAFLAAIIAVVLFLVLFGGLVWLGFQQ